MDTTVIKEYAAFLLQYWPTTSTIVVGVLTSIATGDKAAFLSAVSGVVIGLLGAKPAAAAHARLTKRTS
jgi:hypothetical protein